MTQIARPMLATVQDIPAAIGCAQDYETLAPDFMAHASHEYIAGGCGQDRSVANNRAAFGKWSIYPRLLRDVRKGHTGLRLTGRQFAHPLLLAPVAFQKLAHPGAEMESARAAHATATCMIASTLSSCALEEIASAAGEAPWFQLYFQPRPSDTLDLVKRAERAGYGAIVLTVDAAIQVAGRRARQAGFVLPADCQPANLARYAATIDQASAHAGSSRVFQGLMLQAPTWPELEWLLASTGLPVWVKGISHPDDARALQQAGVAGIVVSNHGGRSLDEAPASLDVLPAVRAAVSQHFPVLFDSGIRCGSDVFKALALGADAVLIGRLQMYALSVAGALGVAHMLKLLREELEVCMALAGCASLEDIHSGTLLRTGAMNSPDS